MWVSRETYAATVNECTALRQRNAELEAKVPAALEACECLKNAAGVVDGAQVMALQGELAMAKEQIARQETALRAYETAHLELNDALRTVAEQRDGFRNTVERMSREGAWTPEGVSA